MNISQRLRTCARHTGLDAVIELLNEAADEIERLKGAQPAEVTDSMIREAFLTNGFTIKDGHSDLKPYVYAAARSILALRPVQVPMDKQDAWDNSPVNSDWEAVDAYLQGIEDAESHHGITAHDKKDTP